MMIDLHSHVLHAVDDGPESLDTAIEMLQQANETGIRAVVATPHVLDGLSAGYEETITARFQDLAMAVIENELDIDIYLGSEVHFQFRMEDVIESCIGTYRGMGRYFLVEVPLTHYPARFEEALLGLISRGKIPIFAHPERVGPLMGNIGIFENLVDKGVLIQVNSGSVIGKFGSQISDFTTNLLDKGLVHFIASDAHSPRRRTFTLEKARDIIVERYGEETSEKLLFDNPMRVLFDENMV